MRTIPKPITLLLLLAFLLLPFGSAQAKGVLDGRVIFGDDFTLASGETLDGDLVVFGGDVTIEDAAKVNGSIIVLGGTITQAGQVQEDLMIIGGQIDLAETALVQGDIVTIGGQLARAAGAVVRGEVIENVPAPRFEIPDSPSPPAVPHAPGRPSIPEFFVEFNPLLDAMNVIFRALAVAALAMLLSVFLQPQIERVSQAIVARPLISGSVGLLTLVLAPFALLLMIVTILLIPVAFLAVIILMLAWLFGVIAIGGELGERLSKALNQAWTPALSMGLGTFLLMSVAGFVGMIPCVGALVPLVIGLVAVGGVVLTWFGAHRGFRPAPFDPTLPAQPSEPTP